MNRIAIRCIMAATCLILLTAAISLAAEGPRAGEVDPKTGKTIKYWVAPMDPTYIRDEPGKSPMGMDLVPVYEEEDTGGEKLPASTIRIDPVTIQNMGVRTAHVHRMPLVKTIRALGTITYDERNIYTVNTKFDGWIERLYVDFVGEEVKRGQPLFDIYSPELVTAQEEYRLALEQYEELNDSPYESVRESARRLLESSRKRLRYWDLTEAQIERLANDGEVSKAITVYSPANGVVIEKMAFEGHMVMAGEHQYEIANLSTVWVDVEIYEYELPFVEKGMQAEMELSYLPGRLFYGKVIFIYPFLSPETRTARLRLEFENPNRELKPDMYANVFLESAIDENALVVPQEAVIDTGVRTIVFLALGEGRFQPREIEIGAEGENVYQVLSGRAEPEVVDDPELDMSDIDMDTQAQDLDMSGIGMDN